jgi:hypothetical protein
MAIIASLERVFYVLSSGVKGFIPPGEELVSLQNETQPDDNSPGAREKILDRNSKQGVY